MRLKKLFNLLAGVLLAAVVVISAIDTWRYAVQPKHAGHSLAYWLDVLWESGRGNYEAEFLVKEPRQKQSTEAIRQIGTNALPCLLERIAYVRSPTINKIIAAPDLDNFIPNDSIELLKVKLLFNGDFRAEEALRGFWALQEIASPAIPELERLAMDPTPYKKSSYRAVYALAAVGPNSLPVLLSMMTNNAAPHRSTAAFAVGEMGPKALSAVPVLTNYLAGHDAVAAYGAAQALGLLALAPEMAVPALTNALQSTDIGFRETVLFSLSQFGTSAVVAVPYLQQAQTDTNSHLADIARKVLKAITTPASTNRQRIRYAL